MASDERNFRSSYYEKVGCYSVEEKKSLNKLLSDPCRNHAKLKQFCLTYTVPTAQRSLLWGIILGILPIHKESTEYIREQRKAVYCDLLRAVTVMQFVDSSTQPCRVMHAMWLLENNRLLYPASRKPEDENFVEIAKVFLQIFDNEIETYWIAKEFYKCIIDLHKDGDKLKQNSLTLLKREDIELLRHLEKLGIPDLMDSWYATCFAGIISESALVKVWDKICGGSRKVVIFIFLELVKTFREPILRCNSQKEFKALIGQIKDQDAAIVNKAIKAWQSNKNHTEITVH